MTIAPPVSRNAPCPCGSGRRYKDCHGALAVHHCRESATMAPRDVAARNLLGEALIADDPAGAEAAWRTAAAADRGNAEARFHLGNLARERGDAAAALAEYGAALAVEPDNAAALNNLGLAQEALGDREAAQASYRRVLAKDPHNTDALANLANVLFAQGMYAATEALYRRLFALRPQLPAYVWLQRGHALRDLGRPGEAFPTQSRPHSARLTQGSGCASDSCRRACAGTSSSFSRSSFVKISAGADSRPSPQHLPRLGRNVGRTHPQRLRSDALLMGVPVLTCAGDRLASRIPGSQLHALGMPEVVTDSLEGYEATALKLARDRPLLRSLRTRLAANRATQPLFDMRRYSTDFETLTLRAWAAYLATRR